MNPDTNSVFWIILTTCVAVLVSTCLCFWMLNKARSVEASTWLPEFILCPIIRSLALIIIISQIYPSIHDAGVGFGFWDSLGSQSHFRDLVNILFFAGLIVTFAPIISHPVIALPLQSCLIIALVFRWQYESQMESITLTPNNFTIAKIVIYMSLAFLLTRKTSGVISHWVDRRLNISGSILIIADAMYLSLQIPVVLLYCSFLKLQVA